MQNDMQGGYGMDDIPFGDGPFTDDGSDFLSPAVKESLSPAVKESLSSAVNVAPAVKVDDSGMVAMGDINEMMAAFKKQLIAPVGRRIKLENKVFRFPEGDEVDNFRCVIVGFVYANSYYDTDYVPGVYNAPKCFSISLTPKGAEPSKQIVKPQCYECDMCWANQFGSKGRGKACQNRMQIAVLPLDADEGTNLYILDLSPTAIRPFNNFLSAAVRALQVLPQMMSVLVDSDRSVKWDVVQFSDPQPISDSNFVKMVMSRRQEAQDLLMTEPNLEELGEKAMETKGARMETKGARKSRM